MIGARALPQKISLAEKPGFYFSPQWSPDSKKVAYLDSHQTLWFIDLIEKKPIRVDKDPYWGVANIVPAWSPDSKWLAYARRLKNFLGAIFIYSLEQGKSTQITDGMSDARHPVFDREGKYLYFTASTDVGASLQPDIHAFSHPSTRSVYLIVLDKTLPSPLAPESDEEKPAEEKKADNGMAGDSAKPESANSEGDKSGTEKKLSAKTEVAVKIDLENILQRVLTVPMPPRRYIGLQAGKPGVLLAIESPATGPGVPSGQGSTVHRYDMKARKSDVVKSGVSFFEIAQNGKKYLSRQGDRWYISALKPMPAGNAPVVARQIQANRLHSVQSRSR